VAVPF